MNKNNISFLQISSLVVPFVFKTEHFEFYALCDIKLSVVTKYADAIFEPLGRTQIRHLPTELY